MSDLDLINSSMGRSQDPNQDLYSAAMGGWQDRGSSPTPAPTPAPTPTPTPTTATLAAPTIAREGSPGTAPFSWTIANDSFYHEGFYWQVQRATSAANLTAGTLNGSAIQQVTASDLYGDPLVFAQLGSTPVGPLALRMRIGSDDGDASFTWSGWSNVLTDTIAASYAAVFDAAKLSIDATLSADKRTMTSKNVGYNSGQRAVGDTALSAAIGYVEFTLVASFVTPDRGDPAIGLVPTTYNKNTDQLAVLLQKSGYLFINGGYVGQLSAVPNGGTAAFALHKATGKLWVRMPDRWYPDTPAFNADGSIASGTGYATGLTSFLFGVQADGGDSLRVNAGQDAFIYSLLANVPGGWA